MNNIILTGFMGTGKTTVGRRLAARLGRDFYDTDEYIKKCEKMSVYDIMKKKGGKYFEGAQRFAVKNLADTDAAVISTGGGTMGDRENHDCLKASGSLIWLRATAETILKNTTYSKNKRLELAGAGVEDIKRLLDEKESFYSDCDLAVDVDDIDVEEICDIIVDFLHKN